MKPFYKSKMLWFNALAVVVFVAGQLGYADFLPDENVMAIAAGVLNLVLRFLTDQAVTLKAKI